MPGLAGTTGPAGPTGPTGPTGPMGPAGSASSLPGALLLLPADQAAPAGYVFVGTFTQEVTLAARAGLDRDSGKEKEKGDEKKTKLTIAIYQKK